MATTNPINTPGFGKYQLSGSIFECIDAHTCGNPVRVVVNGGPALEGVKKDNIFYANMIGSEKD
jgi:hypothetical protein